MPRYLILHARENCIGCGACVAIAPGFWKMNKDGKSDLKGATKKSRIWEREISEQDFNANKQAANSCPANAIDAKIIETEKKSV